MSGKGKLAVVMLRSFRPRLDGSLFSVEVTKVLTFPVCVYICGPALISLVITDTGSAGLAIRKYATVLHVLAARALAQVGAAIIQGVVVPVISKFSMRQTEDHLVHERAPVSSACVKRARAFIPEGVPSCLRQPSVVSGVHDGVVAMRERDKFDRLVLRLDNLVTFHAAFHKEPHIPCATVQSLFSLRQLAVGGNA